MESISTPSHPLDYFNDHTERKTGWYLSKYIEPEQLYPFRERALVILGAGLAKMAANN